nr:recombination repair protein 1 [Leptinotarsa decemlineata]
MKSFSKVLSGVFCIILNNKNFNGLPSRFSSVPSFSPFLTFVKEAQLLKMPPKRKATTQKSKENPVTVQDIEPEVPDDFVDKKPRNKRGAAKKDVVEEVASAEPEEVVKKKSPKGSTKTKDVVEEVVPSVPEVVEKKSRRAATKTKDVVEEDALSVPEEVVVKKSRRGGTTKTKAAVKESAQEEPKKSARGKTLPAKADNEEEEEITMETKKSSRSARGKKKEEELDANGTEQEKKRATRKKKADPEPLNEEPKLKGRKKATKEKEEEKVEKPSSSAKTTKSTAIKKKVTKDDKKAEKEEKVPLNKTTTDWDSIDFTCSKRNAEGMSHNLIISCWNIGGLKSWVKKDCLKFLEYEKPDILCIQETRCSEEKLPDEIKELKLYKQYWCPSEKDGYAGVGILTIKEPISVAYGIDVPELDEDGRCITAEFKEFYLICVYVPNAGKKLKFY